MLTIDNAPPEAWQELAAALHPDDAAELQAAGLTVADAVAGVRLQALRWHGQLVALFGCAPHPTDPGAGIPWMLCTTTLADVPRVAMALVSDQVVSGWRATHSVLCNFVHRRNARALRFVSWLGFTVGAEPCGPGGEFFLFQWRRGDV